MSSSSTAVKLQHDEYPLIDCSQGLFIFVHHFIGTVNHICLADSALFPLLFHKLVDSMYVCLCVCAFKRERERASCVGQQRQSGAHLRLFSLLCLFLLSCVSKRGHADSKGNRNH